MHTLWEAHVNYIALILNVLWETMQNSQQGPWCIYCGRFHLLNPSLIEHILCQVQVCYWELIMIYFGETHLKQYHGAWTLEAHAYKSALMNVPCKTQTSNLAFIVYVLGYALA